MHYSIRHITQFRYSTPIHESVMEVRMQPRDEGLQRCLNFTVEVNPAAAVHNFCDYSGNTIHTFDIPGQHDHLTIKADSLVALDEPHPLPDQLSPSAWAELDQEVTDGDFWEMLLPSARTMPTKLLHDLAAELEVSRRGDPLTFLRQLNAGVYRSFNYKQRSTNVRSPIDDALRTREGVCQDFAHILIALLRGVNIPARYVSGYLFHRRKSQDRSVEDATHAWVEAYMPGLGWIGVDPTNNILVGDRHIRVAIGADYDAVPPTRGLYRGNAASQLGVSVQVHQVGEKLEGRNGSEPDSITYVPLPAISSTSQRQAQQAQQQQ